MVVKGVWFHEVDDIESVGFACFSVGDSEIVPLGVTASIIIGFQNQIVFIFVDLNCSSQISRFKPRFEQKCIVIRTHWNVEGWDFSIWSLSLLVIW